MLRLPCMVWLGVGIGLLLPAAFFAFEYSIERKAKYVTLTPFKRTRDPRTGEIIAGSEEVDIHCSRGGHSQRFVGSSAWLIGGNSTLTQQRLNVAATPYHMKDQDVLTFDAVDDDVLTHGKTAQPRSQLLVAPAAQTRVTGENEKALCDGINEAVGDFDAAAFYCNVVPKAIKFSFGLGCYAMRHQR